MTTLNAALVTWAERYDIPLYWHPVDEENLEIMEATGDCDPPGDAWSVVYGVCAGVKTLPNEQWFVWVYTPDTDQAYMNQPVKEWRFRY